MKNPSIVPERILLPDEAFRQKMQRHLERNLSDSEFSWSSPDGPAEEHLRQREKRGLSSRGHSLRLVEVQKLSGDTWVTARVELTDLTMPTKGQNTPSTVHKFICDLEGNGSIRHFQFPLTNDELLNNQADLIIAQRLTPDNEVDAPQQLERIEMDMILIEMSSPGFTKFTSRAA